MKERGKLLVIILVSVIIILCCILAYGFYTGIKVKAEINRLNAENQGLNAQLDSLTKSYDLLKDDVAGIYKTCMTENACKGRYPNVRWYCNNVGDEVSDPSHICVCDSSCNLNATEIQH
jgi:outer membrane murein-binding lipoprotein Lpp